MILPLAKLGTLALRTLSKPLATRLKTEAARHPRFRNYIVSVAQMNHRFQVNIQRRIYGHATDVEIRPLNEEKAVQAASDLLGEAVVFSVGVGVVIFEVQRGAKSEARKEDKRKEEVEDLRKIVADLAERLETLENAGKGNNDFSNNLTPFGKNETTQTQVASPKLKPGPTNLSSFSNTPKLAPTMSSSQLQGKLASNISQATKFCCGERFFVPFSPSFRFAVW